MGQQEEGTSFGDIADGSSNTILVLEVDDEHATPWTKPESLDTDGEQIRKLFGDRKAAMSAFCDGSTRAIPAKTSDDNLQHLVERSDGNVVEIDNGFARRRRNQSEDAKADPRFVSPGLKQLMQ